MRDPFRGLRVDRKGCQTRHDTTVRAVSFFQRRPIGTWQHQRPPARRVRRGRV